MILFQWNTNNGAECNINAEQEMERLKNVSFCDNLISFHF